jgi:hypothetical protein
LQWFCLDPSPTRRSERGRAWTSILVIASLVWHLPARDEAGYVESLISLSSSTVGESDHITHAAIKLLALIPEHQVLETWMDKHRAYDKTPENIAEILKYRKLHNK